MEMFKFDESFIAAGSPGVSANNAVVKANLKDRRMPSAAEIDHFRKMVGGQ